MSAINAVTQFSGLCVELIDKGDQFVTNGIKTAYSYDDFLSDAQKG